MNRRDLLAGMGTVVAAAVVRAAVAAEPQPHDHTHMHSMAKYQTLIDTASQCVNTGEICLDHCHLSLADGDKTLGECARSVSELIAACTTLRSLAAQESKFLPKYAKLTMEVCKSCEAACRKHEKAHAQCKDCADACAACAKVCDQIPA